MIVILTPVLGRPAAAQPLVDSIRAATTLPHRILFLATPGDDAEIAACKETGADVLLVPGETHQYARKINAGVKASNAEWFLTGADDLVFHEGWAEAALSRYEETGCPVIGTNDLGNSTVMAGKHATHSLVHRSYIERGTIDDPDKLLHEYEHCFCDTEFIATAIARGCFAFAADSHVEHRHFFWGKGEDDAVYRKGRESYQRDGRLFQKRRRLWR